MGYANAVSLDRLKAEVKRGGYDAVFHVGGKTGGEVGTGSLCWFYSPDWVGLDIIHLYFCCHKNSWVIMELFWSSLMSWARS